MVKNKKLAYLLIGLLIIIFLGLVIGVYKVYKDSKSLALSSAKIAKLSNYQQTSNSCYSQPSKFSNEVQKIIKELDTPKKLIDYLNSKNFQVVKSNKTIALMSDEFIKLENNSQITSIDFASFASLVFEENNYSSIIFLYKFNKDGNESQNYVVIFRDGDTPRYLTYTTSGFEAFEAGWSAKDLCQIEEERLNIKTSEYTTFIAGTIDFSNPLTWDNCH